MFFSSSPSSFSSEDGSELSQTGVVRFSRKVRPVSYPMTKI